MIAGLLAEARLEASRTAQTAALGLGASFCLIIGMGFLTLSAWFVLIATMPLHLAALVLGCVYFGIALILFGVISAKKRAYRRAKARMAAAQAAAAPASAMPSIIAAFTTGLQAGKRVRS